MADCNTGNVSDGWLLTVALFGGRGVAITSARKTRNRSQEQSCASVVCLVVESGDRDGGGGR